MPTILDAFCGEGLVHDGLVAAGWTVIGCDLKPKRNYPGPFIQADFLSLDDRLLRYFDAIWASPPCLRDTAMRHAKGAKGSAHPELIIPTRKRLQALGIPYVIENVEGAQLVDPVILCGSMFGLGVDWNDQRYHLERHRKFETNWPLAAPGPCDHRKPVVSVFGGHARVRAKSAGGRGTADFVGFPGGHRQAMGLAMGVDPLRKFTCSGISDGIPAPYAEYVGRQLLSHMTAAHSVGIG